nr:LLM class flavin-dependent oxidoreductase [Kutzneria buriramensis]WKX14711.1 LLM class flavin-dependent oxidoreductase [Kutzneria buriramensis]
MAPARDEPVQPHGHGPARETERIGLVTTCSTTFNAPYNLARQFKALDVISHGRAG